MATPPVEVVVTPITEDPVSEIPFDKFANLPIKAIEGTDYVIVVTNDGHVRRVLWSTMLAGLPSGGTSEIPDNAIVDHEGSAWVDHEGNFIVF